MAVLPIGSFEQHGAHLPLTTDTVIACTIAGEMAAGRAVQLLPPLTVSCSHEHAAWPGTVSISARTLHAVVTDIAAFAPPVRYRHPDSRQRARRKLRAAQCGSGIRRERRADGALPRIGRLGRGARPGRGATSAHSDMHAGEVETSILLHAHPELVRTGYESADCSPMTGDIC